MNKALTAGSMTNDEMTFRIGAAACEVTMQVQKHKGADQQVEDSLQIASA
jgi:hypothetical protein